MALGVGGASRERVVRGVREWSRLVRGEGEGEEGGWGIGW